MCPFPNLSRMVDDPLKVALSETEMQTSRNQTHMLSKICVVTPGDESPTTLSRAALGLLLWWVTKCIFPSFFWQSICLLKVSVKSNLCSCSASCISPASLPAPPGSPCQGCQAPLKWQRHFIACHKKKFPFLQPESTPFSSLGRKLSHLFGRDFVSLFQGGAKTEAN